MIVVTSNLLIWQLSRLELFRQLLSNQEKYHTLEKKSNNNVYGTAEISAATFKNMLKYCHDHKMCCFLAIVSISLLQMEK